MLQAALDGNPTHLSRYMRDILPNILNDLQSPLAAPGLSSLYIRLEKCVFSISQKVLGEKNKVEIWKVFALCFNANLCEFPFQAT